MFRGEGVGGVLYIIPKWASGSKLKIEPRPIEVEDNQIKQINLLENVMLFGWILIISWEISFVKFVKNKRTILGDSVSLETKMYIFPKKLYLNKILGLCCRWSIIFIFRGFEE